MALRSQLLTHALPHLPAQSFTRPALLSSLRSIKPEIQDPDAVLDTIFGPGTVGGCKALVQRWEEEGRSRMDGPAENEELEEVLRRRIEYSAQVGEHLVEAYANLATPSSTPSIPLPSISLVRQVLSAIQLPPSYSPPGTASLPNSGVSTSRNIIDQLSTATGGRVPFLSANLLGPLGYAWRIADEALHLTEQKGKKVGAVKRGYWNEPVGPGPEYYTKRIGLAAVYLSAESKLLQPYPALAPTTGPGALIANPHLPSALSTLQANLSRYNGFITSLERGEANLGDLAGVADYIFRSWGGLIRSRYL